MTAVRLGGRAAYAEGFVSEVDPAQGGWKTAHTGLRKCAGPCQRDLPLSFFVRDFPDARTVRSKLYTYRLCGTCRAAKQGQRAAKDKIARLRST